MTVLRPAFSRAKSNSALLRRLPAVPLDVKQLPPRIYTFAQRYFRTRALGDFLPAFRLRVPHYGPTTEQTESFMEKM